MFKPILTIHPRNYYYKSNHLLSLQMTEVNVCGVDQDFPLYSIHTKEIKAQYSMCFSSFPNQNYKWHIVIINLSFLISYHLIRQCTLGILCLLPKTKLNCTIWTKLSLQKHYNVNANNGFEQKDRWNWKGQNLFGFL